MSLTRSAEAEKAPKLGPKEDVWAVKRFFDELKVVAHFFGPQYSHFEAIDSAHRIWPRYFGQSLMPEGLLDQMYKSLEAAAVGDLLDDVVPIRRQPDCFYPMGAALFELVAIAMYRRWFFRRDLCPIPFEFPVLLGDSLPTGSDPYVPKCINEGEFIQRLFPNI